MGASTSISLIDFVPLVQGEGEGPPTGGAGAAAYAAIKAAATARQVETQREGVREEAQAAVGGDMGRAADGSDA